MPSSCVVPECRTHYGNKGPNISTFQFPVCQELRDKWIRAIKREASFTPSKHSRVCELHFRAEDIERSTKFYTATGDILDVPLKIPRLKKNVIPSLQLPGCPKYLTKEGTVRESPNTKRLKLTIRKPGTSKISFGNSHASTDSLVTDTAPQNSFPRDPEFKRKWFHALGFPDNKYLPQRAFVCCRHFKADDFIIKANGVAVLKTGAVPSAVPQQPFTDESPLKSQEEEFMQNVPLQNIEQMPGLPGMGVHSFRLVNVDAIKEKSQTQSALSQPNTSTMVKLSKSSPNTTSDTEQNIICPSTGTLRSASTGLEVKPPPIEPSPVIPTRVIPPPARWKNTSDPNFSLSSAPVQRITLRKDLKEKPPVEPPLESMEQQQERGVLDLDRISEQELVKLIESDSPLLRAEMVFASKRVYKKRLEVLRELWPALRMTESLFFSRIHGKIQNNWQKGKYIGDLTIDDFGTPAGKMFYLAAKKRAGIYRTKIRTCQRTRNTLRTRLGRFNRMLKILESSCDVSEAKKILEGKENDDFSSESSSSKEEDESDIEPVIMNPMTRIDPVHFETYEKQETRINHFDFSNRVQVKFLPEGDTEMINTLKTEINKLSHADISKSKRIDELYNTIFKKNKIIEDLQRQIEELKQVTES